MERAQCWVCGQGLALPRLRLEAPGQPPAPPACSLPNSAVQAVFPAVWALDPWSLSPRRDGTPRAQGSRGHPEPGMRPSRGRWGTPTQVSSGWGGQRSYHKPGAMTTSCLGPRSLPAPSPTPRSSPAAPSVHPSLLFSPLLLALPGTLHQTGQHRGPREVSEPPQPLRGSPATMAAAQGQWRGPVILTAEWGGAGCQEDFLEEEVLELGLGGQGGFARGGVEKGIPGRRNSPWVWGPSDSLVAAESSDQTQEGSKRARAPL